MESIVSEFFFVAHISSQQESFSQTPLRAWTLNEGAQNSCTRWLKQPPRGKKRLTPPKKRKQPKNPSALPLLETNMAHENKHWKKKFLLETIIFRYL